MMWRGERGQRSNGDPIPSVRQRDRTIRKFRIAQIVVKRQLLQILQQLKTKAGEMLNVRLIITI